MLYAGVTGADVRVRDSRLIKLGLGLASTVYCSSHPHIRTVMGKMRASRDAGCKSDKT